MVGSTTKNSSSCIFAQFLRQESRSTFMRILSIIIFMLVLSSCATQQAFSPSPSPPMQTPTQNTPNSNIDFDGLQHYLGFDSRTDELGYGERYFNTCQIGFGYSSVENCHIAFFVQVNFQLLCRDSEGTISTSLKISEQRPLSGRHVKWKLEKYRGTVELDESGKGQLHLISARSLKEERLKITVGNDFVMQIAGETDRVLTPRGWCH